MEIIAKLVPLNGQFCINADTLIIDDYHNYQTYWLFVNQNLGPSESFLQSAGVLAKLLRVKKDRIRNSMSTIQS